MGVNEPLKGVGQRVVELPDFAEAREFDPRDAVIFYSDKIPCSSSISAPGAVTFGLWLASSSRVRQPSALARAAN
jgi:hypothetical protein